MPESLCIWIRSEAKQKDGSIQNETQQKEGPYRWMKPRRYMTHIYMHMGQERIKAQEPDHLCESNVIARTRSLHYIDQS